MTEYMDTVWNEIIKHPRVCKMVEKKFDEIRNDNRVKTEIKNAVNFYKSKWFFNPDTCCGVTKNGLRCKRVTNDSYCHDHTPQCKYDHTNCCICLNHIGYDKKMLACNHSFHSDCIKKWFKQNLSCPLCRQ